MSDNTLRDLDLAGVRWELSDTPIGMVQNAPVAQPAPAAPRDASSVVAEIGRAATAVVPPIAPVQTMSLDTVRAMASRPSDMSALNRMIGEFNHPLRATATTTVLSHIAPNQGGLMIVCDIPGSDDDACGQILSGASGELMDKMLTAIGQSRDSVSIVPVLFWRTPGGRTPTRPELDLARPFVDRAIDLIKPRVILTLGTLPAAEMVGANLGRAHGVPVNMENGATCVPIFHPNYLLLKPMAKRDVWTALQNVQNILKTTE